nr:hypothetical protein [Myxococcota bacterium]
TSVPGFGPVSLPTPAPRAKGGWQRWALLGAIVVVIVALAITRQTPSPPSTTTTPFAAPSSPTSSSPSSPTSIRAVPPPLRDEDAAEDWEKIVDRLYARDYAEARARLHEFERSHGESNETRSLGSQLDSLPAELLEQRRGKGRGRGKWKR